MDYNAPKWVRDLCGISHEHRIIIEGSILHYIGVQNETWQSWVNREGKRVRDSWEWGDSQFEEYWMPQTDCIAFPVYKSARYREDEEYEMWKMPLKWLYGARESLEEEERARWEADVERRIQLHQEKLAEEKRRQEEEERIAAEEQERKERELYLQLKEKYDDGTV